MNKEKFANKYAKMFSRSMQNAGYGNHTLFDRYRKKFLELTNTPKFEYFAKYKTMSVDKVYAAITHAKVCEEMGIGLEKAQNIWETYTAKNIRRLFEGACKFADMLPNGYKLIAMWLYKDAQQRIEDKCLTYEKLKYTNEKLDYIITNCMYVEAFDYYGIKPFCKVFCNNDLCIGVMKKRAKFIRYSDLVDSSCCHDEVVNLRRKKA